MRSALVTIASRLLGLLFLPWRIPARLGKPQPRRILIVKPCCFGDVVMATAALAAAARAYPQARLTMLVGAWSRPAVAGNPRLDACIDAGRVGTGRISEIWREYISLARTLRAGRFDTALVLDRSPLLGLLCWLAGIRVRAGLDSAGRGFALTHAVDCPPDTPRHEVAWYLDVVAALGTPVDPQTSSEFFPSTEDEEGVDAALGSVNDVIVLHVGGGANPGMRLPAKRWAPSGWIAVLHRLLEADTSVSVVLAGGASDEDRATAAVIMAGLRKHEQRVLDLTGKLSWGELGALARRCRLFLGPDTGATHLAVAAGATVVAVFGPSDPRRYGPWDPGGRSVAVGGTHDAALLANTAAALAGVSYNENVTPDEVWQAVQAAMRNA